MNLLDVVLMAFMALASWTGFRLGLAARAVSWVGIGIGLFLATISVPFVLSRFGDLTSASNRLFIGIITLFVTVTAVSVLADGIGMRVRHRVRSSAFGPVDRLAGAVAGALSVLVVVWFLLPAAASTPGEIARTVRGSTIVALVDDAAPPPPAAARSLARLVDRSGFPTVFADLQPAPVTGPPPSEIPVDPGVVEAATASTINVEAFGCGSGYEGSGFVVAPGLVATNAHVVAGSDEVQLKRPDGVVVPAVVVHVDDDRDLALLEAPEIGREPLPLADPVVDTGAATIGYPGGQDTPRVAPVTISADRPTVGFDIRHQNRVERRLLFLAASLQQGDSGSAVIDGAGAVVGVIFAVSPDDPDTAFALHVEELRAVLAEARIPDTGACL